MWRALGLAAVVAVVAGLALDALVGARAAPARSAGPPTFAVLDRPARPSDRLPAVEGTLAELLIPGSARRVGRAGGTTAYVAAGRGDMVCLLLVDGFGTGGGCKRPGSPAERATYVGQDVPGGVLLLVPVPDGYGDVRVDGATVQARDNAALLTVPRRDGRLTLSGPGGTLETPLALSPGP